MRSHRRGEERFLVRHKSDVSPTRSFLNRRAVRAASWRPEGCLGFECWPTRAALVDTTRRAVRHFGDLDLTVDDEMSAQNSRSRRCPCFACPAGGTQALVVLPVQTDVFTNRFDSYGVRTCAGSPFCSVLAGGTNRTCVIFRGFRSVPLGGTNATGRRRVTPGGSLLQPRACVA